MVISVDSRHSRSPMLARSIRRPSPVVSPADFFPFDPRACARRSRSLPFRFRVYGEYRHPKRSGTERMGGRASERAGERMSKRTPIARGTFIIAARFCHTPSSNQKLSAARNRQYQFWNALTSTKIHKRDLRISEENVENRMARLISWEITG